MGGDSHRCVCRAPFLKALKKKDEVNHYGSVVVCKWLQLCSLDRKQNKFIRDFLIYL
jgi:hypothetical protein